MKIEYELTFEDFLVGALGQYGVKRWVTTLARWILLLMLFAAPFALQTEFHLPHAARWALAHSRELAIHVAGLLRAARLSRGIAQAVASLAPLILLVILIAWSLNGLRVTILNKSWRPWDRPCGSPESRFDRFVKRSITIFALLAMVVATCFRVRAAMFESKALLLAGGTHDRSPLIWVIATTTPTVLAIGAVALFGRKWLDTYRQYMWSLNPHRAQPISMEFGPEGLIASTTSAKSEIRWEYFRGFRECPEVFLIYSTPLRPTIIPKRIFANGEELNAFRSMLAENISKANTR